MKHILAIFLLLLLANSAMANIIDYPTSRDCLQYTLYRESRGESLETMRAVADVVLNRARKNKVTICETILAKGQFPYAKKGIKKVTDKQFLRVYYKVIKSQSILPNSYLYFNHKPHNFGKKTLRIGNLYFSK